MFFDAGEAGRAAAAFSTQSLFSKTVYLVMHWFSGNYKKRAIVLLQMDCPRYEKIFSIARAYALGCIWLISSMPPSMVLEETPHQVSAMGALALPRTHPGGHCTR